MKRGLRSAGMLLALLLLTPTLPAQDKKADTPASTDKDKKQAADKLIASLSMTGKVVEWDKDERLMTLTVKLSVADGIDEGAVEAVNNKRLELARLQPLNPRDANYAKAVRDRLNQIAQIERDIATNQAKIIKYKDVDQRFTLHIAENANVRLLELPPLFDDKGFPVKRTDAEMRELRGKDSRVPGYKGELGDIKPEGMVHVVIAKKRGTGKPEPAPAPTKSLDKKPVDRTDEMDKGITLDKTYQGTMVVVGAEEAKK